MPSLWKTYPTEALDLQQLPTYGLVLSQGFQFYVTIIISCSRHPFKNCFLPTGYCAEHVIHVISFNPQPFFEELLAANEEIRTQDPGNIHSTAGSESNAEENESPFPQHSYDTPDACREEGIRSVAKVLTRHHLIVTYITCF